MGKGRHILFQNRLLFKRMTRYLNKHFLNYVSRWRD